MRISRTSVLSVWISLSLLAFASGGCSDEADTNDDAASGRGGTGASNAGSGGGSGTSTAGSNAKGGSSGSASAAGGGAGGGSATSGNGGAAAAGSGGKASAGNGGSISGTSGDGGKSVTAGSGGNALGGAGQGGGGTAGGGTAGSGGSATAGSAGKAGSAGTGGAAGSANCPTALVGWATVSGDNVESTTGGGNATPVRPSSAEELMALAADDTARVIEIQGTFNVPRLDVNSNKTLIGLGNDATINGGIRIRGYDDALIANVIIRNLRVNGATTTVDDDAVQLYFAHHVWLDHMEIWDGPDGNLDMTHAVNWVTVSWTKFRYTSNYMRPDGESSDHRFSSLIGHSDNNATEDTGRLKVSFHHNWWAEGVIERMPRVRFGQVHVFNNYFSSQSNNYCVRAGRGAQLLIEGNYFDRVGSPHQFNDVEDEATASITARDNEYDQTSGDQRTGGEGPAFTSAPYAHSVEAASGIPAVVQACAGPR